MFPTAMTSDSATSGEGESPPATTPTLVIRPRGRWAAVQGRELWEFRDLLWTFAIRDIRLRYRQTALGVVWVVLQPLLAALAFAFVFGRVAGLPSGGVPYIVFAFAGQLGWQVFSGVLSRSVGSLITNAGMVSKIYFPRILLPLSVLGAVLLDFIVGSVVMAVLLVGYDVRPGYGILLMPLWLVIALMLSLGLGFAVAGLAVRYRDVQHLVPLLTQVLLFASPVAYSLSSVPESIRSVYQLNPLSGLFEAVRWSLLGVGELDVGQALYTGCFGVAMFVIGALAFSSLERDFADVI